MPTSATSDPNDLPIRDESLALATVGGDAALAARMLDSLIELLPSDLRALHEHAAAGALTALADQAHKTNGGVAYCGVPALSASLLALERSARGGDATLASLALARVETEIERLRAWRGGSA